MAINSLRNLEVSERIVVTSREVEDFYKKNPQNTNERYFLKFKIVSYSVADTGKEAFNVKGIKWDDLGWIEKPDLSENMQFIVNMKEEEVSKPIKIAEGYQFTKFVKKEESRLKTLDEAWGNIEKIIQKDKMEKFEKDYIEELKKKASIIYL